MTPIKLDAPLTLYKLTDSHHRTYGSCTWGPGVSHETSGKGPLCSSGWLHAYEYPLLAVLLNPIHANFPAPVLWLAEGSGECLREGQLKLGVTKLTTVRILELPAVSTTQRIRFAILCALAVCTEPRFVRWAQAWLDTSDRSATSAFAAAYAAVAYVAASAAAAAASADAAVAATYAADAAAAVAYATTSQPLGLVTLAIQATQQP